MRTVAEPRDQRQEDSLASLRVLHLLAPARFGGLESVVHALAAAQASAGHEVAVGAILDESTAESSLLASLDASGVATHRMLQPSRSYLRERSRITALCRSVRPDIVHTHGYRSDVLHGGRARKLRIPVVSTVHGFTGGGWKNRVYEMLQRRALRSYDAVVAVSQPLAEQLIREGIPKQRVHCIPNAWTGETKFLDRAEARRMIGVAPDQPCVGFVGRLSHEKGPDVLIEAVALLRCRATTVVVGDGPLRDSLNARAREIGRGESVRFLGTVENAGRIMKAFDVIALSSRTEGTPVVLLEAMAAGVPVVAARVGGVPDVVSPHEALLVSPSEPDELARAVCNALTDVDAAQRRVRHALSRLEDGFGKNRWLERYDQVYRGCRANALETQD